MKNLLLSMTILLSYHGLMAQTETNGFPLSIGYFSQFGFQPGAKISTSFKMKEWNKETGIIKHKVLFISPQLGFFVRPKNNTNFLMGLNVGIQAQKLEHAFFSAYSIGLNYLYQRQIQSVSVPLGEINPMNNIQNRSYFLPTINYTLGRNIRPNLNGYIQLEVGQRIGGNIESASIILLGLGLQMKL